MDMKNALEKIRERLSSEDKLDTAFQYAEWLMAIVTGIFIKSLYEKLSMEPTPKIGTTLFLTSIFGGINLLLFLRRRYRNSDSTAPADYAISIHDKDVLKCEIDRHKTLAEFIDRSIQSLNKHTCAVSFSHDESDLCKTPLEDGLKQVLLPIIEQPHHLLACSKSKFTVVLRISNAPAKSDSGCCLERNAQTMHFRDDFGIRSIIDSVILGERNATGTVLRVFQQATQSENESILIHNTYDFNGQNLKVITSPIPAVCEEDSLPPDQRNIGVFYIICDESIPVPSDVSNTLKIFGRISANWISKYETCLVHDMMLTLFKYKEDGTLDDSFDFKEDDLYNGGLELPQGIKISQGYVPPELRGSAQTIPTSSKSEDSV